LRFEALLQLYRGLGRQACLYLRRHGAWQRGQSPTIAKHVGYTYGVGERARAKERLIGRSFDRGLWENAQAI